MSRRGGYQFIALLALFMLAVSIVALVVGDTNTLVASQFMFLGCIVLLAVRP